MLFEHVNYKFISNTKIEHETRHARQSLDTFTFLVIQYNFIVMC